MVWVRKEYAGELAVTFTWLSALLPWGASWVKGTLGEGVTVTVVNVRFVFFQFHYLFGISFGKQPLAGLVQFVHEIPGYVPNNQRLEGWLWLGAATVYLGLLLLSVAFYVDEERVTEALPVDPVRLFGAVLGGVGLVLMAVSVMLFSHQTTIPIGAVFMTVFGALLLRVERT
ncbi:MAG: hypothetical protein ABEJ85_00175 [Haloarculaceae archaeon]